MNKNFALIPCRTRTGQRCCNGRRSPRNGCTDHRLCGSNQCSHDDRPDSAIVQLGEVRASRSPQASPRQAPPPRQALPPRKQMGKAWPRNRSLLRDEVRPLIFAVRFTVNKPPFVLGLGETKSSL